MPRKPTSKVFPELETEKVAKIEEEQTKHLLVNEDSPDYLKKVELIDGIRQAPNKAARRDAIADAAKALDKSTRTIKRMVEKVEQVGVATLAVGRKDKGQYRISKQWHDFIPLLSLSGRAIARSLMRQSIQAILLEKNWSCICY